MVCSLINRQRVILMYSSHAFIEEYITRLSVLMKNVIVIKRKYKTTHAYKK